MINVKNSKFITSASSLSSCPPPTLSEVAFLGRSNVGKSSLINKILESNLAKSSSTPGKTRLINFFQTQWESTSTHCAMTFNVIDLPGIGYAKVSKDQKNIWQKTLWDFITKRNNIKLFVHLIDSRHRDLDIDKALQKSLESFRNNDQNILCVFTKADKLTRNDLLKLYQKLEQKKALVMANNDTIINPKYGGKQTLREAIFQEVLIESRRDERV